MIRSRIRLMVLISSLTASVEYIALEINDESILDKVLNPTLRYCFYK